MDNNYRYLISKKNLNSDFIQQIYVPPLKKIDYNTYMDIKTEKVYKLISKEKIDDNVYLVNFKLV
jgi:hypothetical protein